MSSMVINRQETGQSNIMRGAGSGTATFRPTAAPDTNNSTASSSNLVGLAGSTTSSQTASKAPLNFLDQGIWGSNSLGFGSGSTRTNGQAAARTGSSALLDDSVSDGWNRNPISNRLLGSPRRPESQAPSRPQTAADSLQQTTGAASLSSTFFPSTRPPTINLNASANHHPKPSYSAGFTSNSTSFGQSEQPPAVYTKFDRPAVPGYTGAALENYVSRSQQGSASQSPAEERRSFISPTFVTHHSMPGSRNSSLPPSRHGEEQQPYEIPPVGRPGPDSYRRQSTPHANVPLGNPSDSLNRATLQFGQMSFGDHRPSQSFSTTNGDFGPSRDNSISDNASSGQYSRRGSRQIESMQSLVPNGFQGYLAGAYTPNAYDQFQPLPPTRVRTDPSYASRDLNGRAGSMSSRESRRDSAQSRDLQMSNAGMSVNANVWGQVDHRLRQYQHVQSQIDPNLAQMMLRNLNAGYMMHPQNMNMLTPYFPAGAMIGVNLGPQRDLDPGHAFRSSLLDDFKNAKATKKHELREIFGHVVEFSGDQGGSRFLQTKMETANSEEKSRIFDEILPECHQLMIDVFGNYVIQRCFELCDQVQKKILAHKMKGHVVALSLQMYGCRVVQKALEHCLNAEKAMLVTELANDVMRCVKDPQGNHVIQCAIQSCPVSMIGFIFDAFRGQVSSLSGHAYGCRVVQRCLEHENPEIQGLVLQELRGSLTALVGDQFGNYVVQSILSKSASPPDVRLILDIVSGNLETFSKHKFASNVVEKCLLFGGDDFHREVVDQMVRGQDRASPQDSMVLSLIKDSYGNYVIQKMCEALNQRDYARFVEVLQPEINKARRMGCGKQVSSIEKKMNRPSGFGHSRRTPTYASRAGSAERTPCLTNSNSAQTSSLSSSVNGDAIEGASNSRKNSVYGIHH
ncbi:Pumilio 2 [Sphaceloma murrayae]|uniref:Pumilio 2 n=1 Tax=Sphaceloma murrayae TaxID=2082308 RepID=A0A2K1QG62_9PEZI|nr:Pumilio 2 [Sphaceloma murrayae]